MAMDENTKSQINDLIDLAKMVQGNGIAPNNWSMVFQVACRLAFPDMEWKDFNWSNVTTPLPYPRPTIEDILGAYIPKGTHRPEIFTQPKVELTTPKEFDEKVNGHPT